jgi:sec-independent protein translocase protein TatB
MGGTEIVVILIVALLFLGPDKLPEAAKQISKGIRDIKKQSRVLQRTIEDDEHIGGAIRDLKSALRGEDEPIRVTAKTILPAAAATVALPQLAGEPGDPDAIGDIPRTTDAHVGPGDAATAALAPGSAEAEADASATGAAVAGATDAAGASDIAGASVDARAAEPPRLRMSPTAGEPDDDAPRTTDADDAELAAMIRPAPNTVARGFTAPAIEPAAPADPAEPKHG